MSVARDFAWSDPERPLFYGESRENHQVSSRPESPEDSHSEVEDSDLEMNDFVQNRGTESYIPDSDVSSWDSEEEALQERIDSELDGELADLTALPIVERRFSYENESRHLPRRPSRLFTIVRDPSVPRRAPSRPKTLSHSASKARRSGSVKSQKNPDLVTWDGPDDPKNPHNWPLHRRWICMLLVSSFTFISPVASTMVAPALDTIAEEYEIKTDVEKFLVMSIFLLAYAVGPFLWGPLSEVFGRVRVLQCANLIFLLFNTVCGFAKNKQQMMAFRFLGGIGGSAPQAIGGGVLSDCFRADQRGRAIAVYSLMPFLGPSIGPIAGGYITQYTTWRWVFWSTSIFDLAVQLLALLFLQETYPAALLAKKAKALRLATGNPALHTKWQGPDHSIQKILMKSLVRPFIMLTTQPALQAMALFRAYQYGLMYLVLATFPMVFEQAYGQAVGRASLNYLSLGIGFLIGLQISGPMQDKIYSYCKRHAINPAAPIFSRATWTLPHRRGRSSTTTTTPTTTASPRPHSIPRKPVPNRAAPHPIPPLRRSSTFDPTASLPEHRLPLTLPFSLLIPLGLLIYGLSAGRTHWLVPNLGAMIFATGLIVCFNCAQAYVVDTYTTYAASATGAAAFVRTMAGFAFPLFAGGLYEKLGIGGGNGVLAGVSLLLGVLCPLGLWRWGGWLRGRSTYCTD